MKTLLECFDKHSCDKGSLKHHYERVYERTFSYVRDLELTLLEVGVFKGASVAAWIDYFPNAQIVAIDTFERVIPSEISILKHPRVSWLKCDSTQPDAQQQVQTIFPQGFDFIIDDGLHTHDGQRLTFENLFPLLKQDGRYFIEDVFPFQFMHETEKQHPWLLAHPNDFSDEKYAKLHRAISQYKVSFHDLRTKTIPDSYIMEVYR